MTMCWSAVFQALWQKWKAVLHAKTSDERGFLVSDWWLPPEKVNFNWLGGDGACRHVDKHCVKGHKRCSNPGTWQPNSKRARGVDTGHDDQMTMCSSAVFQALWQKWKAVLHAKTSDERGFLVSDWWLPPEKVNFNWLGGDGACRHVDKHCVKGHKRCSNPGTWQPNSKRARGVDTGQDDQITMCSSAVFQALWQKWKAVLHAKTRDERGFLASDWRLPPEKNFNWLGGDGACRHVDERCVKYAQAMQQRWYLVAQNKGATDAVETGRNTLNCLL